MNAILRHAVVSLAALLTVLAGSDPCTVGAAGGRMAASCASVGGMAMACPAGAAGHHGCSSCCQVPTRTERPSPVPSCRDLKPQAPGAPEQPTIGAPIVATHPASSGAAALLAPSSRCIAFAPAPDESPPDVPPAEHSSRAPPLS
ncbi:MAG TPA: hypothetical protein VMS88_05425 [Terriglobales bacterium]|nr:hypothetical protein [Terriglobales bacterium]